MLHRCFFSRQNNTRPAKYIIYVINLLKTLSPIPPTLFTEGAKVRNVAWVLE